MTCNTLNTKRDLSASCPIVDPTAVAPQVQLCGCSGGKSMVARPGLGGELKAFGIFHLEVSRRPMPRWPGGVATLQRLWKAFRWPLVSLSRSRWLSGDHFFKLSTEEQEQLAPEIHEALRSFEHAPCVGDFNAASGCRVSRLSTRGVMDATGIICLESGRT